MKKITRIIFCLVVLCLPVITAMAQTTTRTRTTGNTAPKTSFADQIFYGGNVGFYISDYWVINIAPHMGVKLTPAFSLGFGLLYEHENYHKSIPSYKINSYGGSVFARYDLGGNIMKDMPFSIFFQADYEGRQREIKYSDPAYAKQSGFDDRLYLGAGYSQRLGGRTRAYAMISIDMLDLDRPGGIQPIIRAGVEF